MADLHLQVLPAPHPICGKRIHFGFDTDRNEGNEDASWVVAATPMAKYEGELFKVNVNLRELHNRKLRRVFWSSDAYPNDWSEAAVLMKVSSASCFHQLIPSVAAYLYGLEERYWKAYVEIRQVLSQSLYGVYKSPGGGLVQLLPNLEPQKYKTQSDGLGRFMGRFHRFCEGRRTVTYMVMPKL